jgi:hypothetical protein
MAIQDTILSTPVDIDALRKANAPLERLLDGAFANLLFYAKTNWSYTASSSGGSGETLLAGTATAAPCGGIANALRLVFMNGLNVPKKDVDYITVSGYLWTGPTYLCFDPKVRGNLRRLDSPNEYNNGCIFKEHYYLKCGGKYYDPCLSVAYAVKDQSIKERFIHANGSLVLGNNRRLLVTANQKTCILYMPQETVPGFQGAWAMFDTSRANIEKAMGSQFFKAEMAAMHGNSSFAQFVKKLPA